MAHMRIFCDMDGVVVDFNKFRAVSGLTGEEIKKLPYAYLDMDPIPGALEGVRSLIGMGHEVWLATKPPTGIPQAYADKVQWVLRHLPDLKRRIILTHDKSLLLGDVLIDDRPHKANANDFRGWLIVFGAAGCEGWPELLDILRKEKP
jgi:5'(3')-deoxyribonucleotidase